VFKIDPGDAEDDPLCLSVEGSRLCSIALFKMASLAVGKEPLLPEFFRSLVKSPSSFPCLASSSKGSGSPCIFARPS